MVCLGVLTSTLVLLILCVYSRTGLPCPFKFKHSHVICSGQWNRIEWYNVPFPFPFLKDHGRTGEDVGATGLSPRVTRIIQVTIPTFHQHNTCCGWTNFYFSKQQTSGDSLLKLHNQDYPKGYTTSSLNNRTFIVWSAQRITADSFLDDWNTP